MSKFSIFTSPPEFKPRNKFGLREDLPKDQRDFLDAFDVMEQKMDHALLISSRAHNLVVLVIIVNLIINGKSILHILQGWAGASPVAAQLMAWFTK